MPQNVALRTPYKNLSSHKNYFLNRFLVFGKQTYTREAAAIVFEIFRSERKISKTIVVASLVYVNYFLLLQFFRSFSAVLSAVFCAVFWCNFLCSLLCSFFCSFFLQFAAYFAIFLPCVNCFDILYFEERDCFRSFYSGFFRLFLLFSSYDKLVLLKVVTACLCMIRRKGRRSRKLANVRSIR